MNLKKNVFSHLMWFVYSAAVCVGVLWILVVFGSRVGYTKIEGFAFGAVWLLVCGWIVFIRKQHTEEDAEHEPRRHPVPKIVKEILLAVLLLAVGLFVRVQGLTSNVEGTSYYELAKVAEGQTIPSVVHGAVYIYLEVLHLVYLLFGNKLVAGVWLQIVLLAITGGFLYAAVRKMAGALPALASLAFLMVGPYMMGESLILSPQIFFLAIYAIALFLSALCIAGKKRSVTCLLTGLLVGAVCYFDVMGVTLLFFLLCGILMQKSDEQEPISGRLLGGLLALIGGIVGFLLLIGMDSVTSGKTFLNVLSAWGQLYQPSVFTFPDFLNFSGITVEMVVLLLFLPLGVMSYWFNRETEKSSPWILATIVLLILTCFGMTTEEMNGAMQFYMFFAVMAGISVSGVIELSQRKEADSLNINRNKKKQHADEKNNVEDKNKEEEVQAEETAAAEQEELTPAEIALDKILEEGKQPKVAFLENPLPLPKTHVKKVLDYDIVDIHPTLNCYDVRVPINDDFDV